MELLEGKLLAERVATVGALDPGAAVNIIEQIAERASRRPRARRSCTAISSPTTSCCSRRTASQDFVKVLDFGISQASWRTRLTQKASASRARRSTWRRNRRADCASRSITAATSSRWPRSRTRCSRGGAVQRRQSDRRALPGGAPPTARAGEDLRRSGRRSMSAIMRGLAKESADRFPDVLVFAGALRAAIEATAAGAVETSQPIGSPSTWRSRRPSRWWCRCHRATGGGLRRGRADGARRHRPRAVPARTGNEAAHPSHAAQEPRADANRAARLRGGAGDGRLVPPGDPRADPGRLAANRR